MSINCSDTLNRQMQNTQNKGDRNVIRDFEHLSFTNKNSKKKKQNSEFAQLSIRRLNTAPSGNKIDSNQSSNWMRDKKRRNPLNKLPISKLNSPLIN